MSNPVIPLHPIADVTVGAASALTAVHRHLDRCKLSANTVKAYKRQATAYVDWLTERSAHHSDAFADLVGPWTCSRRSPPGTKARPQRGRSADRRPPGAGSVTAIT